MVCLSFRRGGAGRDGLTDLPQDSQWGEEREQIVQEVCNGTVTELAYFAKSDVNLHFLVLSASYGAHGGKAAFVDIKLTIFSY